MDDAVGCEIASPLELYSTFATDMASDVGVDLHVLFEMGRSLECFFTMTNEWSNIGMHLLYEVTRLLESSLAMTNEWSNIGMHLLYVLLEVARPLKPPRTAFVVVD